MELAKDGNANRRHFSSVCSGVKLLFSPPTQYTFLSSLFLNTLSKNVIYSKFHLCARSRLSPLFFFFPIMTRKEKRREGEEEKRENRVERSNEYQSWYSFESLAEKLYGILSVVYVLLCIITFATLPTKKGSTGNGGDWKNKATTLWWWSWWKTEFSLYLRKL